MSDDLQALLAGPAPAHPAGSAEAQNAARAFMQASMGIDPTHPHRAEVMARRDALFARAFPPEAEGGFAAEMGAVPEAYSLPSELPLDPAIAPGKVAEMLAEPQAWAKGAGLSNDDFRALAHRVAAVQANPPTAEQAERSLRAVWGDAYDRQLSAAQRAAQRIDAGGGKFLAWLRETNMANDPHLALRLAALAQQKGW